VWLELYDSNSWDDWTIVTFAQKPPHGPFADPKWTDVTPDLWRSLWLKLLTVSSFRPSFLPHLSVFSQPPLALQPSFYTSGEVPSPQ
jgi:hypothetical protein